MLSAANQILCGGILVNANFLLADGLTEITSSICIFHFFLKMSSAANQILCGAVLVNAYSFEITCTGS